MKKNYLNTLSLFVLGIMCGISLTSYSQTCIQSSQFPSGTTNISSNAQTLISNNILPGNYSVNNFTTTGTYVISTSRPSHLTLTDNTNTPILSGPNSLTINIATIGLYRIHLSDNSSCSTGGLDRILAVDPLPASSLNFDGTNDNVNIGNSLSSALVGINKITAEAWVKPITTAGPYRIIVGNYSTPLNQMQFCIRQQGANYTFFIGNGNLGSYNQLVSINTVTTGIWQHVAGTWDGSVASFYVNGVLTNTASITYPSFGATTNSVVIGINSVPEPWSGDIDEVRIWNRALCQAEIQNNMNGEIATTAPGLLANYHFNQGFAVASNPTVTSLTDATGNGYIGTLLNFSLVSTTSNWVAPGGVTSGSLVSAFVSPTVSITGASLICAGSSSTLTASGNVSTYAWVSGPSTASYTVTPTSSTTYSVTGKNSLGCISNVATISVTVNSLPNISVNSGAICPGQSFTMVPNGADTYTYSNGTDVVMPTADATYSVSGTDANGCENTAISSVTVNPLPVVTSNPGNVHACGDVAATFGVASAGTNTYEWFFENAQLPVDSALIDGSYTEINFTTDTMTIQQVLTANYNNYYVYCGVTNQYGCTSYSTNDTIWANPLPTIYVNSGTICEGQSFTMTPSGADTYVYSNGNAVASPTTTSTYTITGTNTVTSCSNNSEVIVTVNALPTLLTTTTNTLLCTGETATLSVTGADMYTWSTTESTINIAVSPTVQTTYTVDGTDANGCVNTTTIMQDVSLCTGIVTTANINEVINLFPNPNNGLFTLELTTTSKVTVTNSLGQFVIAETFEAGKHNLDIQNEARGVYFVKVIENNREQTIKVVKQ